MKIAFFGSSLVSAYWNGAATYYRGIVRALHGRGHQVRFFEPDAYDRQKHRDIADPPWACVEVYDAATEDAVLRTVERARGADLVVKASGVGVHDALLERAVLALQGPATRVVFWDVDAPATLERLQSQAADPFRALVPRYDLVLTYGGGDPVVRAYRALGARDCVPIYNALDPDTHNPVAPDPRFEADLGFLGNRLPDREARVEDFFLGAAQRLPDRRFLLGGSGWHDKPLPPNVRQLGHVYTADHNAFNGTPRAVLNISRDSMARFGFSPATRVFEAAGAGACLITDAWEGIAQFFAPGEELLVAQDGAEVAAHLDALTPRRARAIGQAALRRVLAEHTYAHRAAQLDAVLEGSSPRHPGSPLRHPGESRGPATAAATAPDAGLDSGFRRDDLARPRLSIVILGLSITSSWGNGHATTWRSLVRALVEAGHEVLFLERDVPWYAAHRDLPQPPWGHAALYGDLDELRDVHALAVRTADLVIVGSFVPEGAEVGDWVLATARGLTATYDIDTPVTLARLAQGRWDTLRPDQIARYGLYLSFTGGPTLDRLEREFGSPRARVLYCSVDPTLYHPEPQALRWDLGYMGTYSDDRQPGVEALLLQPARAWTAGRFIVAGAQYPDGLAWPANVQHQAHLPPATHRAFYNAQRFTLNITRADMKAAGWSPSVRLFEAAACGTPILSDRWPGLETLLTPGHEIVLVDTTAQVLAALQGMDEEARHAMGDRARRRILAQHTAAHRAAELVAHALDLPLERVA